MLASAFNEVDASRVTLCTCRGRAVGLLHDWQGGYVKTESGYGKRIQHRKACNRPRPFGLRPAVGAALAAKRKAWFHSRLKPLLQVAPTGHSLRHAPRRAIDLASNAARERYIEVPFSP